MPLFNLPIGAIELYMLVYLRVLGLLITLPVFGDKRVPRSIKAGLTAVFAMVITMGLWSQQTTVPVAGFAFVIAAVLELTFGLMCGWMVSWVLEAVIIGMHMVGFQMGLAIVNVVDPSTGASVSIIATYQARVAVMVFLAGGIYRPFLQALADSFTLVPLGAVVLHPSQAAAFTDTMALALRTSVGIAGAPIAALFLSKVGMGVVARAVPQMNVFIVGFPLTIAIGLIVTAAVTPYVVGGVQGLFEQSLDRMVWFMSTAAP
jgi:flagellar biosynthesis protein FliR